jgi:hypothetical protein
MILNILILTIFLTRAIRTTASTSKELPNILFILADDLGWHDTSVFGDPKSPTPNLKTLADEGIRLKNHYTHWHCSPSRRSFLTGRNPNHHGEFLSQETSDDIDLRWRWISEILQDEGYVNYWFGKGHTGYASMNHLPIRRGFDGGSVFFLAGSGSYTLLPRWNGSRPCYTNSTDPHTYSTDLFGSLALDAVEGHDTSKPLFLYLPWQAVHSPYDLPPNDDDDDDDDDEHLIRTTDNRIAQMIRDVDTWIGRIVLKLKEKNMYENTLIVFTSDNGGTQDPPTNNTMGGNNFPMRGAKHSNWQGGMRTQTFVSGGFIPDHLHNSTNEGTYHIVDWYPTFCHLVGGQKCHDSSPVPPLPVDPNNPTRDIYRGSISWPSVDGLNIMNALLYNNESNVSSRPYLWLSAETMIKDGRYKIVTAQQDPSLTNSEPMTGWRKASGDWIFGGELDSDDGCGLHFRNRSGFKPCLFDLTLDEREMNDLSLSNPELLSEIWTELNRTALTAFTSRSPPSLLGNCNKTCSSEKWKEIYGASFVGPICGVC